jgi:FkbM family methyltransferase
LPMAHRVRGLRVAINGLQRFYGHRYARRAERWTIIGDFDGDLRMKVDRASHVGSVIYWFGNYSPTELRLLDRLLSPEMVLADIGANQGEFTLFAAKRLSRGTVLAFEPMPAVYAHLGENIALNHLANVCAHNVGLADEPGVVEMYTADATDPARQSPFLELPNEGVATMFSEIHHGASVGSAKIEVFDEIFAQSGLQRLDVMKIDVEGAELAVLRGARRTITQYRPHIFMEVNRETTQAAGYSPADLLDFLMELGYEVYRIKSAWQNDLGKKCGDLSRIERHDLPSLPIQCDVLCSYPGSPLPI